MKTPPVSLPSDNSSEEGSSEVLPSPDASGNTLPSGDTAGETSNATQTGNSTEVGNAVEIDDTTGVGDAGIGDAAEIDGVVEIREKMFIAQTNDIYLNSEDYLGKTIKYEGIFKSSYWEEDDTTYHFVIRYGPGCCGYDGEAGFEVNWDGGWPQEDDWCEVIGVLEEYEVNGQTYLQLALTSLTVLEKRGEEFVSQ
ncbi:uncharacterized membrane protein YcgQ (UPF0703/DUF1980 family) [Anaerotaenia torta]|uniref:TIGR03943 family putative permease subunit n=1 Tax=Anaerotaenia torta TaxID=433293 RepID=UPI003D223F66